MPNTSERNLDSADRDEKQEDKRMEDLREKSRRQEESFVASNDNASKQLFKSISEIEIVAFHSESLDSSQREFRLNSFAEEADPEREELDKTLDDFFKNLNKKAPPEDKKSNNRRYLAYFFGLLGVGGAIALIYECFARKAKDEPADDIDIPQEEKDKIEALFIQWQSQSDEDFWENVAKYQETTPTPTLADQLYFCQYTKQLSTSPDVWIWEKGADEMTIVEALEKLYRASSPQSTAVMYRNITKQSYQGKKLPRDIAAEVLTLTLGQLLKTIPN